MNSASVLNQSVRLGQEARWADLDRDRAGFQTEFVRLVGDCPQASGRVLDIGCGAEVPAPLRMLARQFGSLDGVDPEPGVAKHPLLQQRWNCTFEKAPIPPGSYDLAYAYNVLEHIASPAPFFGKVCQALKPGGVFWALTPNRSHPFALLSRSIELVGLKGLARQRLGAQTDGKMRVNDYPAYYRCNSPRRVLRALAGLGFSRATFYFHPCLQWDTYFPGALRWAPHAYDFLLGARLAPLMQIFIVRLDKAAFAP
jgi:SAM-dependent methyltransferase